MTEPSSQAAANKLKAAFDHAFPVDFLNFVNKSGSQVDYPEPALLFEVFSADEIIEANAQLDLSEFLPNFFVFGSDRGNELLTFKLDEPYRWAVFMTPMIVMSEEDSVLLAANFTAFLDKAIDVRSLQPST